MVFPSQFGMWHDLMTETWFRPNREIEREKMFFVSVPYQFNIFSVKKRKEKIYQVYKQTECP